MNRFLAAFALLSSLVLPSTRASADPTSISMVTATSVEDTLPFAVFGPGQWAAEPGAEWVKLHIYPDAPMELTRVDVVPCKRFAEKAVLYVNFDEMVFTLKPEDGTLSHSFEGPVEVRSLTFNFQRNKKVCVDRVRLFGADHKPMETRTPRIVKGQMAASDTLEPASSYGVSKLFDSRYEYAWSSNAKPTGVTFTFDFPSEETIEKLRVWNGYQRSDVHCFSNTRAKTLVVTDGAGYATAIGLKDIMGAQVITLPKPFKGKHLIIEVTEAYPGTKYKDLVISELRFFGNGEWFMLDPMPEMNRLREANLAAFRDAGLEHLLGKSLWGEAEIGSGYGEWTLRLRTDGSLFVEGDTYVENYKTETAKSTSYYGLGNYEVRKSDKEKGVRFRVFGFLRKFTEKMGLEMDCNGCGRDCNGPRQAGVSERIFQDFLGLKKEGDHYILRNIGKNRDLKFKRLKMEIQ